MIQTVLGIALGILLIFLIIKVTKVILKTIAVILLVILIIVGLIGVIAYKDIKEGKYTLKEKVFEVLKINKNSTEQQKSETSDQLINIGKVIDPGQEAG